MKLLWRIINLILLIIFFIGFSYLLIDKLKIDSITNPSTETTNVEEKTGRRDTVKGLNQALSGRKTNPQAFSNWTILKNGNYVVLYYDEANRITVVVSKSDLIFREAKLGKRKLLYKKYDRKLKFS